MTEAELRRRCGLREDSLINSSKLGLLDILGVELGIVTFEILATEKAIAVSVETVVSKLTTNKEI